MERPKSRSTVLLLGNDPGALQWSMLDYGLNLQRYLSLISKRDGEILLIAPNTESIGRFSRHWRIGRATLTYWSRYAQYPLLLGKKPEADLFHILDHSNSWLLKHLDPAKTVITCHDLIPLILRNRYKPIFYWLSDSTYRHMLFWLSRARLILTNSSCTKQDIISRLNYPENQIHVTPLGIDDCFHRPKNTAEALHARRTFGLPEEKQIILHVGHNAFYKNIEGLISCLGILASRKTDVILVRAGGVLSDAQKKLAGTLGVENRIVELGPLSKLQLTHLYQAADLLLFPSFYEGQGLPCLEAMAAGLPVITSNRGALPETVGNAALLIEPEDLDGMADAVQKLLGDTGLREDLRAGGSVRAAQFRWEITAQKTWEAYRSLKNNPGNN